MRSCTRCGKPTRSHHYWVNEALVELLDEVDETTSVSFCHSCWEDLDAEDAFGQAIMYEDEGEYYVNEDALDEYSRVLQEVEF